MELCFLKTTSGLKFFFSGFNWWLFLNTGNISTTHNISRWLQQLLQLLQLLRVLQLLQLLQVSLRLLQHNHYSTNSGGRWPRTFWAVLQQVLPHISGSSAKCHAFNQKSHNPCSYPPQHTIFHEFCEKLRFEAIAEYQKPYLVDEEFTKPGKTTRVDRHWIYKTTCL